MYEQITIHPSTTVKGTIFDSRKDCQLFVSRWGIRQISGFTIGDWKYSKVENPVWHKMALTWPVDASGALIPDLQWPLEGCLIPGVPPIKALKSTQAPVACTFEMMHRIHR